MKFYYFYLISLLSLNVIIDVKCQTLFWYDTTQDLNPDFDMDHVPDNTYINNPSSIFDFLSFSNWYPSMEYSDFNNPTYDHTGTILLIHNQTTFNAWTRETIPQVTIVGYDHFPFYDSFFSTAFFPADYLGYGNDVGEDHNYKWCSAIVFESQSNLDRPSYLKISHSDDLFVFSKEQLIYSYVGITDVNSMDIMIDYHGHPHEIFRTVIVNCNRKKRIGFHLLEIFADYPLQCLHVDECGVCNQNGESCNCQFNPYICQDDEYFCIKRDCVGHLDCQETPFNCSNEYPHDACISKECQIYGGCITNVVQCDDNDQCTNDFCDPIQGCINEPIQGCVPCDPNHCISNDLCIPMICVPLLDTEGECVPKPVNCTSPNQCIIGSCIPENGQCAFVEERNCNDDDHCTIDSCNPDIGCVFTPIPNCLPCGDNSCITTDLCFPFECSLFTQGVCVERPVICSHPDPCIIGTCENGQCNFNEIIGCGSSSSVESSEAPITCDIDPTICQDDEYMCIKRNCIGSACIESTFNCSIEYPHDQCIFKECQIYGGCITNVVQCDDNDQCTNDFCDPIQGCVNEPIEFCVPCDPDHCISNDLCIPMICVPLLDTEGECVPKPINCTSPNQCIIGSCIPENGQCAFIDERNCNDNDHCTIDSCNPDIGCVFTLIPNCLPCGDDNCITTDLCFPFECSLFTQGGCVPRPINCSHPDPCIIGTCELGQCNFNEIEDCGGSSNVPITSTTTSTSSTISTSSTTGGTTSSTTGGTTSSTTGSTTTTTTGLTTSVFDPCSQHKCPIGKHCYNINGEAVCKKTSCLSCDDLNCHSKNLKCISIKVDLPNPCHRDDCCEYVVSCSP